MNDSENNTQRRSTTDIEQENIILKKCPKQTELSRKNESFHATDNNSNNILTSSSSFSLPPPILQKLSLDNFKEYYNNDEKKVKTMQDKKMKIPTPQQMVTFPTEEGTMLETGASPLKAMFPTMTLAENEPTLAKLQEMSTTDVTKHLVSLNVQADFSKLQPSSRLISQQKSWLSPLTEVSQETEDEEEEQQNMEHTHEGAVTTDLNTTHNEIFAKKSDQFHTAKK